MNNFIGKHVIVRTYSAGVLAGVLKSREGKECVLTDARRLWYWDGAATLSELAMKGTSAPKKCKFPIAVSEILLTECIEIIQTTEAAEQSIKEVPIWSARGSGAINQRGTNLKRAMNKNHSGDGSGSGSGSGSGDGSGFGFG